MSLQNFVRGYEKFSIILGVHSFVRRTILFSDFIFGESNLRGKLLYGAREIHGATYLIITPTHMTQLNEITVGSFCLQDDITFPKINTQ